MEDIKYLTVTELNKIIKYKFDNSAFFNRVFIKGEIWVKQKNYQNQNNKIE